MFAMLVILSQWKFKFKDFNEDSIVESDWETGKIGADCVD